MPLFRSSPFEELVAQATNEQNVSEDWSAIMDICDKTVNYEDGQKFCLQAITKRLCHKVPRVVMQALVLLDACVQNCGKKFHLEVSSRYFVTEIQKILPKMHVTAADKLKQLLRRWAETEFKNDPELGLIPSLYYKLKSEGVEFPPEQEEHKPAPPPVSMDPNVVSSQQEEEDIIKAIALSLDGTQSSPVKEDATDSSSASSVTTTNDPSKVRALYDFEAVEENELTIKAGEIVLILDRSNNSWWKGSNHRGEGYLPANFVTENLDERISFHSPDVDEEETLPKQVDDSVDDVTGIDEQRIQQALDWLNEMDPTADIDDPEELLILERQSHAMAPLIEEKLQLIDKKCTILNCLNEELMKAVELFYTLNSIGSGPPTSTPDHFHTREIHSQPSAVSGQHGYVIPHQYMIKTAEKTASSTGTISSPPRPVSSEAQPSHGMHFQSHPQTSFPPYCYQPLYTMLSPDQESGYQVMVTGIPEQQRVQPSSIPSSNSVPQQPPNSTSSGGSSDPVTNISSNAYTPSALPNAGTSVVYQPIVLQPHIPSANAGGLTYATYLRNVPLQQPGGAVMHPQAVNTYMPQYIAQVVMPNSASSQEVIPTAVHQTSAELATDSNQQASVSRATTSNDMQTPVSSSGITTAASNLECEVKSVL